MPAFGYASDNLNNPTAHAIKAQVNEIEAYFTQHLKPLGVEAGVIAQEEINQHRNFRYRPEGGKLLLSLQEGDHLIIAWSYRAFMSLSDMNKTITQLLEKKVHVHILDMQLCSTHEMGMFRIETLKMFGRFYRLHKQAVKGQYAKPTMKKPNGGYPYLRCRKTFIYSKRLREVAAEVVRLHDDDDGMTFHDIWLKFLKERRDKPRHRIKGAAKEWTPRNLERLYHQERQLRIIEAAFPGFHFPKRLTHRDESLYHGMLAKTLGIKRPTGRPKDFPLVTPVVVG